MFPIPYFLPQRPSIIQRNHRTNKVPHSGFPYFPLPYLLTGGTAQLPAANNPGMAPQPGPRRQWHGMFSSVTANGAQEAIIYVSVEFQQNAEP